MKIKLLATPGRDHTNTGNLAATDWALRPPSRHNTLQQLSASMQELRRQSDRLMVIRSDAEKLFPAMRHMLDKMLPNNTRFLSYATLAMDEAREWHSAPSREEIQGLFSEARYAWSVMIGNFRVFVASRFGAFPGSPEDGMQRQHQQIEFYHEIVCLSARADG